MRLLFIGSLGSFLTLATALPVHAQDSQTETAPAPAANPPAQAVDPDEEWEETEETEEVEAPVKKKKKKKKKVRDEIPEMPIEEDGPRFRGGVSGSIGAFVPGPIVMLGAEGRFGYQIDDMLAVYGGINAMAGLGFGVGSDEDGTSATISAGAAVGVHAMFEATFADVFFVAAGPQLLYGSFVSESLYTDGASAGTEASVFYGPMPGLKFRVGVGFGSDAPSRRKQFTIAFDGSVVFGEHIRVEERTNGSSGTVAVSDGIAVGFLPTLSLGFDAK